MKKGKRNGRSTDKKGIVNSGKMQVMDAIKHEARMSN
jgi:hypothetical protein